MGFFYHTLRHFVTPTKVYLAISRKAVDFFWGGLLHFATHRKSVFLPFSRDQNQTSWWPFFFGWPEQISIRLGAFLGCEMNKKSWGAKCGRANFLLNNISKHFKIIQIWRFKFVLILKPFLVNKNIHGVFPWLKVSSPLSSATYWATPHFPESYTSSWRHRFVLWLFVLEDLSVARRWHSFLSLWIFANVHIHTPTHTHFAIKSMMKSIQNICMWVCVYIYTHVSGYRLMNGLT